MEYLAPRVEHKMALKARSRKRSKIITITRHGPKKAFSLIGLLWKTALLASVVYGGTLFAATKNERVMDFVIDKQLPYYEELIDVIENGSAADVQKIWTKLTSNVALPSKDTIEELTHKIEQQGGQLIEETKKKISSRPGRASIRAIAEIRGN